MLPDYTAALNALAGMIAADAEHVGLTPDENFWTERNMPDEGDLAATLTEKGGQWDRARGIMTLRAEFELRSALLSDARARVVAAINSAENGFRATAMANRAGIMDVKTTALPSNNGRDPDGRNYVSCEFTLLLSASFARGAQ
jgi:hypothetical protein